MHISMKTGLSPLPWVLTTRGFDLPVPVLREAFAAIQTTPFKAAHQSSPVSSGISR